MRRLPTAPNYRRMLREASRNPAPAPPTPGASPSRTAHARTRGHPSTTARPPPPQPATTPLPPRIPPPWRKLKRPALRLCDPIAAPLRLKNNHIVGHHRPAPPTPTGHYRPTPTAPQPLIMPRSWRSPPAEKAPRTDAQPRPPANPAALRAADDPETPCHPGRSEYDRLNPLISVDSETVATLKSPPD